MVRFTRIAFILVLLMILMAARICPAETVWRAFGDHPYKKISGNGYCNCIFSSQPIPVGGEASVNIQYSFSRPEPVYARCYFPYAAGVLKGENFRHELWVDGLLARLTRFSQPPDPRWDQTAVWITEEDYREVMEALEPGAHEVEIRVIETLPAEAGSAKKNIPPRPGRDVMLSVGSFSYLVEGNEPLPRLTGGPR